MPATTKCHFGCDLFLVLRHHVHHVGVNTTDAISPNSQGLRGQHKIHKLLPTPCVTRFVDCGICLLVDGRCFPSVYFLGAVYLYGKYPSLWLALRDYPTFIRLSVYPQTADTVYILNQAFHTAAPNSIPISGIEYPP